MCLMAQSDRYGYLERNGKPIDNATIGRLIRVDNLTLNPLMDELESAGVFSRCPKTNAIYSRRMVKDSEEAQRFVEFGRKGGNPSLKNLSKEIPIPIPIPTVALTPPVNRGVNPKKGYGEFGKVTLTTEEHGKLLTLYGSKLDAAIEALDSYMESNGKKYKSCYATMKKGGWVWDKVNTGCNQKPIDRKQEAYEIELARQRARGGLPFDDASSSARDQQDEKRRLFHWAACDGKCRNWNAVNLWCEKDVKRQPVKADECEKFEKPVR